MKKGIGIFLLGVTLAFGVALAAQIIANAAVKISKKETIRVKGAAGKMVKSNFGSWYGTVSATYPNMPDAVSRLSEDSVKALEFIRQAKFAENEITVGSISVETKYKFDEKGNRTDTITGYTASQTINVESAKVDELDKLSRNFTELFKQNIFVYSAMPSFIITDLETYKLNLLAEASANGKQRAEILAGKTGGKVGALLNASQGIFQVLSPGGSDISDYGTYDKTTIEKEVKAVVTLEFRVE